GGHGGGGDPQRVAGRARAACRASPRRPDRMKRRALFRLGLRGLLLHKLRSTLSILGVVFGVAAVVAMSSVGEGARREALEQLGALGMDSVTLRARRPSSASAPGPGALRLRDAESLARVVPHVVATAPVREADLSAEAGGRRADAGGGRIRAPTASPRS